MWNLVLICLGTLLGLRNIFGLTRWYSLAMRLKWRPVSVRLVIVLVLVQDRCTIYAKRTTSLEIILGTLDGTPR
jgi:hypothetical protein